MYRPYLGHHVINEIRSKMAAKANASNYSEGLLAQFHIEMVGLKTYKNQNVITTGVKTNNGNRM